MLVVGSDTAVREVTRAALVARGFVVKVVPSGLHAIEALKREDFGLVLAEHRLVGMDGLGLLAHLKARFPKVKRVLMLRRPTGDLVMQARMLADARVLMRPCSSEKLVAAVEEELGLGG